MMHQFLFFWQFEHFYLICLNVAECWLGDSRHTITITPAPTIPSRDDSALLHTQPPSFFIAVGGLMDFFHDCAERLTFCSLHQQPSSDQHQGFHYLFGYAFELLGTWNWKGLYSVTQDMELLNFENWEPNTPLNLHCQKIAIFGLTSKNVVLFMFHFNLILTYFVIQYAQIHQDLCVSNK